VIVTRTAQKPTIAYTNYILVCAGVGLCVVFVQQWGICMPAKVHVEHVLSTCTFVGKLVDL